MDIQDSTTFKDKSDIQRLILEIQREIQFKFSEELDWDGVHGLIEHKITQKIQLWVESQIEPLSINELREMSDMVKAIAKQSEDRENLKAPRGTKYN